jgi:4'-phosphopantetheinyl transferase EntD
MSGSFALPSGPGWISSTAKPAEHRHLAELRRAAPTICWDRLLFSAKESVYKAWYPLAGRVLDFDVAQVTFDPRSGQLTADLLVEGPVAGGVRVSRFAGRWLVAAGLAVTAVAVPAGSPLAPGCSEPGHSAM